MLSPTTDCDTSSIASVKHTVVADTSIRTSRKIFKLPSSTLLPLSMTCRSHSFSTKIVDIFTTQIAPDGT